MSYGAVTPKQWYCSTRTSMDCHVFFFLIWLNLQQNYFDMRSKVHNYLQDVVVYLENSSIPYNLLCLLNLFKNLKYLPKFLNFFCA